MMSLTFGLFTQMSGSGPLGPLVGNITNSADSVQMPPNMASDQTQHCLLKGSAHDQSRLTLFAAFTGVH